MDTPFCSSSVHTPSISLHDAPPDNCQSEPDLSNASYRNRLIHRHRRHYEAARNLYAALDDHGHSGIYWRFMDCRRSAHFCVDPSDGRVFVAANSCHLRYCPLCSQARKLAIEANTAAWLSQAAYPKLLTLTLKHTTEPLKDQLTRLYQSFTKLRRQLLFSTNVTGGIWFFQVKRSPSGSTWHPHLHCFVAGNWLPQKALSAAWHKVTGDSYILDIKMIRSVKTAAAYVARYATTACNITELSVEHAMTVAESLYRRRLCGTFGECRKRRLTARPDRQPRDCIRLVSFSELKAMAATSQLAGLVWYSWLHNQPIDTSLDFTTLKFQDPQPLLSPRADKPKQLYFY